MKILFLSRYQNKFQRGAENFVTELSKRISKNHQVDILTEKRSDSLSEILKKKYDIIIPINGRLQSLKASIGRILGEYKLLISGHSGIGKDDIWNILIVKPDIFIALTQRQFSWAKQFAWGSKVVKISNGIDLDKFSPTGPKIEIDLSHPIILSVGALEWYKHHERVIEAASTMDDLSVLIAGEGGEYKRLNSLGTQKLKGRFKICKFKYDDMPKVYRSVDLFSLPSWDREAFGIVYLEAMASGLGVIAPDDETRREIIGDAGIFVDTQNIYKYSDAINKALKLSWEKKARKQSEKFSWEIVAKRYEELMIDMISKK